MPQQRYNSTPSVVSLLVKHVFIIEHKPQWLQVMELFSFPTNRSAYINIDFLLSSKAYSDIFKTFSVYMLVCIET